MTKIEKLEYKMNVVAYICMFTKEEYAELETYYDELYKVACKVADEFIKQDDGEESLYDALEVFLDDNQTFQDYIGECIKQHEEDFYGK